MIRVVYTGSEKPLPVDGVDVLHLPVLEVRILPFEFPKDARIAVFFSKNAIQSALTSDTFRTHPWQSVWGVGDQSVKMLEDAGFHATSGGGSFESFLKVFAKTGDGVVAFGLKNSPRSLAEHLWGALDIDVYETIPNVPSDAGQRLASFGPHWVVLGSPRAWTAIGDLVPVGTRIAVLGTSTANHLPRVDHVASVPSLTCLLNELREISQLGSHTD